MTTQTAYSSDFQQFLQLVDRSLAQAAEDARELAERTGTPLVVRDVREIKNGVRMGSNSNPPLDVPTETSRASE